jgi:hypothetical protein
VALTVFLMFLHHFVACVGKPLWSVISSSPLE